MKANELRIGNYVDLGGMRNLYQITDEILGCLNLNPIPLTEEWLIKLGFEKKENSLFTKKLEYIYNSLKYCEDYKIWIYYNDDNDAACNSIADLNFVHELQNLYFALTKKELTMK